MQTEKEKTAVGAQVLSLRQLKNQLRKDGICLRKAAVAAAAAKEPTQAQLWLSDNYHLLNATLTDCRLTVSHSRKLPFAKATDNCEKGSVGRLFLFCLSLCPEGKIPGESELFVFFKSKALCTAECELLPAVLRCAIVHTAANSVRSGCDSVLIACVRSLLSLRSFDVCTFQQEVCAADRIFAADPADVYKNMDTHTKAAYRRRVARLAIERESDEVSIALQVAERAKKENRHVGFFLDFPSPKTKKAVVFTLSQAVAALVLSILTAVLTDRWWSFFLCILPFYAVVQPLFDVLAGRLFPTDPLFSMKVGKAVPEHSRTVLVVSGLLPKAAETEKLEKHLASLYTANGKGAVQVLFLADHSEADTPEMPTDEADSAAVCRCIDRLNARFDGHFVFALRPRVFSPTQRKYAGHERKRGALLALSAYLTDHGDGGFSLLHGDTKPLKQTKYIFTLDSDTVLSFGALPRLCAVMSHPLNAPVLNEKRSRVVQGYGILVPAAQTALTAPGASFFTRCMTHGGGMGAYAGGVSERNMAVFGKSVFTGKGLADVHIFYDLCADRFPEQRILSHDVLEGGILRAGFEGRTAFAEHFPNHEKSYFERMHRWLRGDWQNAPFVLCSLGKEPVDAHTKLLLADNVRRALTPVSAGVLLFASFFFAGIEHEFFVMLALLAVTAGEVFSYWKNIFSQTASLFLKGNTAFRFAAPAGLLAEIFLQCAMLPQTVWVCLEAAVQSVWRLCISKKNLLLWKTAAHSDRFSDRRLWQNAVFPMLWAVLLFGGGMLMQLYALLLVFHLPQALGFSLPKPTRKKELSHMQKESLVSDCASMWLFFEENANAENHFLPPDNVQETPLKKTAHRTSPTNIGLYLCSILAAADLSFIDAKGLHERVNRCLDTVEKLQKCDGHLLNWYDTKTMQPLYPQYVSTVDSGNFVCCLTALREGLCEYEKAFAPLQEQIARIDRLLAETDFTPLYDPLRKLFFIGMDAETREKSNSCYDLYMSEARMTSYLCVSSGTVEAEHWATLGRTLVSAHGKTGAVSWTGTFFEYFMPCLFLPVLDHSFAAQSLRFCLFTQKRFAEKHGIPWGISESGFYEFDPSMNYSYKAHGVPALALKRNADCECVVAPYASFLALPVFPHAAVQNLRRLRNLDMTGRYGFYEAVDFTKKRTAGEDYCIVRSYMAHHVGMSLLSAVNCLTGNVFVQRFMRNVHTAPAVQLFNERFPEYAKVFCDVQTKESKNRPLRPDRTRKAVPQQVGIFANGEWTHLCDRFGRNVPIFSAHRVLRPQKYGAGVSIAVAQENTIYPLTAHPGVQCRFADGCVQSSVNTENLKIRTAQAVHPSFPASLFAVRADNATDKEARAELCFYLEPYLLPVFDKNSHPAYEKLFISCDYNREERIFVFTRHTQQATLCAAVGFWDHADFSFETDRETVLGRGGADRFAVTERFFDLQNGLTGTDRCLAVNLPVCLRGGESCEHTLILTCAADAKQACDRLRKIRANPLPDSRKGARNPCSGDAALMQSAENLLAGLFFEAQAPKAVQYARLANNGGIENLWQLGISGDRPIVLLETDSDEDPAMLAFFVRLHATLSAMGVPTDFVFLRGRSGGYSESAEEILKQAEKRVGMPHTHGRLFALQKNTFSVEILQTLCAYAQAVYPVHFDTLCEPCFPVKREYCSLQRDEAKSGFVENGFQFVQTPLIPWCQNYANPVFGFLCADDSPGFTWAGSPHFNKITPWVNDTRARQDAEKLLLGVGEKVFDLTANALCRYTDKEAMYEGEADGVRTLVCIATDAKAQKKRITVHLNNTADRPQTVRLAFSLRVVLGEQNSDTRFVKVRFDDGAAVFTNPVNTQCPGFLRLSCSQADTVILFSQDDLSAFFDGKERDFIHDGKPVLSPFAAAGVPLSLDRAESCAVSFTMTFARSEKAAKAAEKLSFRLPAPVRTSFRTGDEMLDRFGNALLLHTVTNTRLFARCGFYQCGGAWGFRDQLQDALSLLSYAPQLTRRQILRCAAVQFLQGDVLHWHHVLFPKDAQKAVIKGVRTRCSDDFLWLPYAVAHYCLQTGDMSVLLVRVPYLDGAPLKKNEKDRYAEYGRTDVCETVYSHCLRSIARGLRFGENGLSLMFGGDWNDAFGKVGENGRGESVWLSMFLCRTLDLFAKVCLKQKEPHNAVRLQKTAAALRANIDRRAWENDRYLRAFFDDKTKLGSVGSKACKLDVLPQAFSVFCAMPDKKRITAALSSAYNTLFDPKHGIVKLFDPPFTPADKAAGYVNFYPVGVRENGGQYTHAAVWFCLALLQAGYREQALEIAKAICPAKPYEKGLQSPEALRYRSEPYAPCGDVSSATGMEGRGGWSLYTGSAGWWLALLNGLSE